MALVILASATGAPGCTTSALGLALNWPGVSLLVDADRNPSQSLLAGYLQGVDPGRRGFTGLLQAHRERRPFASEIAGQCVQLGDDTRRWLLPGFAHPAASSLFTAAWPDLVGALDRFEGDVIVDAGRVGRDGIPRPLAEAADAVLLVTRSSLVSLAGARLYLPLLSEAVDLGRLGLLVVGPGRPYSRSELGRQFGTEVRATLPWDPDGAAVYAEGQARGRKFDASAYVRSLRTAAESLASGFAERRRRIGVAAS